MIRSCVFAFLALGASFASAQVNIKGNCNVVLGEGSSGNQVTVICGGDGDGVFGSVQGLLGGGDVSLEMTTNGLLPGADAFELVVKNASEDQMVDLHLGWLELLDDAGRLYSIDKLQLLRSNIPLDVQIRPGRQVRFPLPLNQRVAADAAEMDLTWDNARATKRGAVFTLPLPVIEWTVFLREGALPDLTSEQRDVRAVQAELARLGYYTYPVDGAWGPRSERALERFQRDIGQGATGNVADGVTLLPDMRERN